MSNDGAVDGLIQNIGAANVSGGGNYFRDGRYLCMLKSMEIKQLLRTGLTFLANLIVLEANAVDTNVSPNPVGTTATFFQGNLDSNNVERREMSLGKIKGFVLQLCNEPNFAKTDAAASAVFNENLKIALGKDNPLRGTLVRVETFRTTTKKGVLICVPQFVSVPGQDGDACRAAFDAAAAK